MRSCANVAVYSTVLTAAREPAANNAPTDCWRGGDVALAVLWRIKANAISLTDASGANLLQHERERCRIVRRLTLRRCVSV